MTEEADQNLPLFELFRTELRTQSGSILDHLNAIKSGDKSEENFEHLIVASHSILGGARIIQQNEIANIGKALENLFSQVATKKIELKDEHFTFFQKLFNQLIELANLDASKMQSEIEKLQPQLKEYIQQIDQLFKEKKEVSKPDELIDIEQFNIFSENTSNQISLINHALIEIEKNPKKIIELAVIKKAFDAIKIEAKKVNLQEILSLENEIKKAILVVEEGVVPLKKDHFELFKETLDSIKKLCEISYATDKQKFLKQLKVVESYASIYSTLAKEKEEKPAEEEKITKTSIKWEVPEHFLDDSMVDLFRIEVETQAAQLSSGLVTFEKDFDKLEELEPLMRASHSIKGAARVVSLEPVVQLSHVMEDCFVAAQNKKIRLTEESVDIILCSVDILMSLSKIQTNQLLSWIRERSETFLELISAIESITNSDEKTLKYYIKKLQKGVPPEPLGRVEPQVEKKEKPVEEKETKKPEKIIKENGEKVEEIEKSDRVLRVTAQSLNRLMGLAGESLVESRWLQPFSDSLVKLKKLQNDLSGYLDLLRDALGERQIDEKTEHYLIELQHKTNECRQNLSDRLVELEMFIRRHSSLSDRLYREVIDSRMRPFSDGVEQFPRLIRDLGRELNKKVRLEILGKSTPVDREILEKLEAPLNHLLRNAIDHGIESVDERIAANKDEEGNILLEARHQAGMLAITISDDGAGIKMDTLRERIISKNLVSEEMGNKLSESELLDFLFLPGFTTSHKVTEISGRGVGLDVVQSMIQEVGGHVRVTTEFGKGTAFHLQLPLTLSVIRALIVEISGEPYAFPLARIDRALLVPDEEIDLIENRQYFNFEGQNIGVVPVYQILRRPEKKLESEMYPVIVISDRVNSYGTVVDKFLGERELVVQEVDQRLGKIPDINSGALMENGNPVLIVDVEDMVRSIDSLLSGGRLHKLHHGEEEGGVKKKRILVVDDSLTVREVECRLLQNRGYEVETAVNGVDGWNAVRLGDYDLVITDVDMPRMNGIELVKLIKSEEKIKNLPVMIVSYKEREEDRLAGLEAGANYYLTKSSFHDETLIEAVEDLVGKA